jgi:negative regulator of sigma-B (phosphoserine phosphatase)
VSHESRPHAGETENGDRAITLERDGRVFVAIVDGLGHGPQAAIAAYAAAAAVERVNLGDGLGALIMAVHGALHGTRGAAMTGVLVADDGIEFCGVGNVALRTTGAIKHSFVPTLGVLGRNFRAPRVARSPRTGGRIILCSDGLSSRFDPDIVRNLEPAEACRLLMARYGRETDDSTVLVADV